MKKQRIIPIFKYLLNGFVLVAILSCNLHFNCGSNKPYSRGEWYKCGGAYQGSNPSMSTDGKKIVFGSTRYGLGDIIIINADGTEWKRLTNTAAYEGDPSFSPDGEKIVFVSERDGNGEIYIMNSDGSDQKRLTISDYHNGAPSFSPDGRKIIFTRVVPGEGQKIKRSQIFIMSADGSDQKRLTYGNGLADTPSFSPDGKKIIFACRKEGTGCLAIMDLDGLNVETLISEDHFFSGPSFSSNGQNIIFQSDLHSKDHIDIHLMDVREKKPKYIKTSKKGDYSIEHPTFIDGDAKIMFFAATSENGGEIRTINLDGSGLKIISKSY
jgi:TolB protein